MRKYNMFSNMNYIYKTTYKACKQIYAYVILNFICSILLPITATLIPTLVVYALTNNLGIEKYLLIIVLLTIVTFVLDALKNYSFLRYQWENTFSRVGLFWTKVAEYSFSTDYLNIEPKSKQKIIEQAFESLSSNWVGVERIMKSTPLFFINFIGMIVYAVIVTIYCPWVLIVLILMSICNFFLTKSANDILAKNREQLNKAFNEKYYLSKDATNANNGKDIRIYHLEHWFEKLFVGLTKKRINFERPVFRKYLYSNFSDTIFLFIRDGLAYFMLIGMVLNDANFSVTTFTFLIGIIAGFTTWLNGFVTSFNEIRRSNIQVNEYRYCLDIKNVFNHGKGYDISKLTMPLELELKNVSFRYPDTDKDTIHGLNIKINPGEKIALVGNNGAGKTTIIKLLCGLYEPTEGEILLNGINIKEFNLEEYMSLLSVVFQDSVPLALTVLNNVTCSLENNIDMDKFWNCLKQAGLFEKINSLETKENTFITQTFDLSGIRLSGGETQKLMLARALYKNTPLLILDEPTAALDPIAEEKMYLTYDSFSNGNTSIFISHRLSSTKFCNRIIYLENGAIAESGTHDELMKLNGKYKEMYNIQSQYYKKEENDEN